MNKAVKMGVWAAAAAAILQKPETRNQKLSTNH